MPAPGLQMTRGKILTQGLQLGMAPSLNTLPTGGAGNTLAQDFFNALLDHLARAQDWAFLRKTTTVNAAAGPNGSFGKIPSANLPSDYHRIVKLHAPKGDKWLVQRPHEDNWLDIQNAVANASTNSGSVPLYFSIDEGITGGNVGLPDIYLWPLPDTAYTYDLIYQAMPAVLTSDNDVPWFPDSLALVRAVAAWAKDYSRDDTYAAAQMLAARVLAEYKANHNDQMRSNSFDLSFDAAHFPTYRVD